MTTRFSRRATLGMGLAALALSVARPAAALTESDASAFVQEVVSEVEALLGSGLDQGAQAQAFRELFERRAAVDQVARFVMGANWRDMSDAQQGAFRDAFLDYVSDVYVSLLSDYDGQNITVGRTQDFGRKGILVVSEASGPGLEKPVAVEWLVSDRGGATQLVDVTIEGVSMLQTQRNEFGAKLERRNGDFDQLIADMRSGATQPEG